MLSVPSLSRSFCNFGNLVIASAILPLTFDRLFDALLLFSSINWDLSQDTIVALYTFLCLTDIPCFISLGWNTNFTIIFSCHNRPMSTPVVPFIYCVWLVCTATFLFDETLGVLLLLSSNIIELSTTTTPFICCVWILWPDPFPKISKIYNVRVQVKYVLYTNKLNWLSHNCKVIYFK